MTRTRERTVPPDGNLETLELVACLDQVFVRDDVELVCLGDRSRGLLRPLQRRRDHVGDVVIGEHRRDRTSLSFARHRQPEAREPSVEDPARVVYFAVAQDVDDGAGGRVVGG